MCERRDRSRFPAGLAFLIATLANFQNGFAEEGPILIDSVQLTLIDPIELPAKEVGALDRTCFREGDLVQEGQLLAQIDDREARLTLVRATKEWEIAKQQAGSDLKLRFARKSQDVAKAELQRALDSVQQFPKSVSGTELDKLRLAAERTALDVELAEFEVQINQLSVAIKQAEVDRAKLMVERKQLIAPCSGMVVQWKRHSGEWVEPGTPVVRIIRLEHLRAEGFVAASKLGVKDGKRPATFTIDLPDQPGQSFSGKLVFVSPEIEAVSGQVRIWAEIENRDLKLRPGLVGRLKISPLK